MNKIQQAYEQGLRVREKAWRESEWIKKYSEKLSIDELCQKYNDDWSFRQYPKFWEIHPEDLHPFKEHSDIKSQIQEHLNKIQELLNQL